jgi:hypothetical protein
MKAEKSTVGNRIKEPKPHFLYLSNCHLDLVLSFSKEGTALSGGSTPFTNGQSEYDNDIPTSRDTRSGLARSALINRLSKLFIRSLF